jgi:hypothetical protein
MLRFFPSILSAKRDFRTIVPVTFLRAPQAPEIFESSFCVHVPRVGVRCRVGGTWGVSQHRVSPKVTRTKRY